jgi:hypothetical protein
MFKARRLAALFRTQPEENMNTPNEFEIREAWQKFLQMPEARDSYHTRRNAGLLQAEVMAGDLPYNANALLLAYRKLKDALDVEPQPVPNQPRVESAPAEADPAEAEKAWVTELEKPLPGENSWQRKIRVAAAKEARARKKYPRAAPSAEFHRDTIRNTNQELATRKARAQQQTIARNTPREEQ